MSKKITGSEPVYLNVYDLTPVNGYAYWLGLGVYHSGVQVHGVEYAYGAHECQTTGIFEGEPRKTEAFTFRKSILIGKTDMGPAEVKAMMQELGTVYKGDAYNLITKNCNHFCNDACIRLTGNRIPRWVNRLARIGLQFSCVLPRRLNSTKARHPRIKDKPCKEDNKKLASQPNGYVPSSNSSPSSALSPSETRGRSRTRRRRDLCTS